MASLEKMNLRAAGKCADNEDSHTRVKVESDLGSPETQLLMCRLRFIIRLIELIKWN